MNHSRKLTSLFLLVLVAAALGAKPAKKTKPPPPPPPSTVPWTLASTVRNDVGSYTPVVLLGGGNIRLYVNTTTDGSGLGTWWRRDGTWSTVGGTSLALSPAQAFDQSGTPFYRTSAVVRGASGNYYAIVHVGDGYPSPTGFQPAWATSPDGLTWTYHGRFLIDGSVPGFYASGASLIVQEEMPATVDHANPIDNRYLMWEDATGLAPLILCYSADGLNWYYHRDGTGTPVNMWPVAGDAPVFPTACLGANGAFHLIARDSWPGTALRHIYSHDGLTWKVLDMKSPVDNPGYTKGTNLVYDPVTQTLHTLSTGLHFTVHDNGF